MSPQELKANEFSSILTSDQVSAQARQYLRLQGLEEMAQEDQAKAVTTLVERFAKSETSIAMKNAVAELALSAARHSTEESSAGRLGLLLTATDFALQAVRQTLASTTLQGHLFDPEIRRSANLYNAALSELLTSLETQDMQAAPELQIASPSGQYQLSWDLPAGWRWMPEDFEMRPAQHLEISGLDNRFSTRGLGAPVVAVRRQMERVPIAAGKVFPAYERYYPLTAILDMERNGNVKEASLRFMDPLQHSVVEIDNVKVHLEADFTASFAMAAGETDITGAGESGMFWPERHLQQTGLYLTEPFRADKIPVVFIHGLGATAATWLKMANDLRGDPEIRSKYQFWFFHYPTGLSFALSSVLCRRTLNEIQELYNPQGDIPAMDHIILVGHSMGGLISRVLVMPDATPLWDAFFTAPLDDMDLEPGDAEILREGFFSGPLPYIPRIMFLATPHKGSPFAENLIGKTGAAIARLPEGLIDLQSRIIDRNTDRLTPEFAESRRGEKGIESTSPDSILIKALASSPLDPSLDYHTILGDRGKGDREKSSDGIVPYWSGHLEEATSEIIVPSNHIVQDDATAIHEVRRILLQHSSAGHTFNAPRSN